MDPSSTLAATQCIACGHAGSTTETGVACPQCGLSLIRNADGVLTTGNEAEVSYPESGHDEMMSVEESSFWFAHRNAVIATVLERFPIDGTLWDVGGGNGFQAHMLEQHGQRTVLLEPGMVGCVNAAKRGVSTVVNATLDALTIAPDSIAGTSMFDVIEHLPDPVGLLRDCREALRPGGRVYVTVPAYQALWSSEDVIAGHFRRYTRSMINQQFTDAGLRTEYVSHFFRPLVAPIFLMRAVPYRVLPKRDKSGSDLSQHGPGGTGQQVVERLLARELSDLKKGRALPYGGSIIAVATKP